MLMYELYCLTTFKFCNAKCFKDISIFSSLNDCVFFEICFVFDSVVCVNCNFCVLATPDVVAKRVVFDHPASLQEKKELVKGKKHKDKENKEVSVSVM